MLGGGVSPRPAWHGIRPALRVTSEALRLHVCRGRVLAGGSWLDLAWGAKGPGSTAREVTVEGHAVVAVDSRVQPGKGGEGWASSGRSKLVAPWPLAQD